jgi:hypothetical protein
MNKNMYIAPSVKVVNVEIDNTILSQSGVNNEGTDQPQLSKEYDEIFGNGYFEKDFWEEEN